MKPMLASKAPDDLGKLPYPLYASPKLDGIRCLIDAQGRPVSRTLKPIRNKVIANVLTNPNFRGLDGELIVGDPNASDCMRVTNSGVMSFDTPLKDDEWKFYVFDIWSRGPVSYVRIKEQLQSISHPNIVILQQHLCHGPTGLEQLEQRWLDDGYEGAIIRRPVSPYKFGRSTVREGHLLKLKRYSQGEAAITGFEPLYHNANAAEVDNLGYTKRSQDSAGKIALDTLGALVCRGENPYEPGTTIDFKIGTGFTQAERDRFWQQQSTLRGRLVSYKFFPTGSKERPRHPVFVSFRSEEDL